MSDELKRLRRERDEEKARRLLKKLPKIKDGGVVALSIRRRKRKRPIKT